MSGTITPDWYDAYCLFVIEDGEIVDGEWLQLDTYWTRRPAATEIGEWVASWVKGLAPGQSIEVGVAEVEGDYDDGAWHAYAYPSWDREMPAEGWPWTPGWTTSEVTR